MQKKELTKIEIQKSLRYSIFDGFFYAIMLGAGESFFQAYAIFLRATNFQIGLIGSLPQAIGSISQLFAGKVLRFFHSRKTFVIRGVLMQALMHIFMIFVFFIGGASVNLLIFFVALYWIAGSVINPIWNSWMGDLVSDNKRGAYFGRRNKICGFATYVTMLAAGLLLQKFNFNRKDEYIGFSIILLIAFAARASTAVFLHKQSEPHYARDESSHYTMRAFLKNITTTNYGLFVFYYCIMNFCVYISAPYFTPYLLNDLKFNYIQFTLINSTILIVKYVSMPIWGANADKFGTRRVLSLCSFLMPLNPILWIFSNNFYYIIAIQALAGFTWAGFELAAFNFLFDTTNPKNRVSAVGYFYALNGVTIVLGGIAGFFILKYNSVFISKFLFVFLVSGILRYLVSIIFVPKLKEVREVEHISYHKLLFKIVATMTSQGLINNLMVLAKRKK